MIRVPSDQISFQGDNVIFNIEYDLLGTDYSIPGETSMTAILGMTDAQIIEWVKQKVAVARGNRMKNDVKSHVADIVDRDLEA